MAHRRREPWNVCPLCGKPLRWVRVIEWTPCDEEPVLFVPGGKMTLIKKRDFVLNCALYKRGDKNRPGTALIPHFYTCEVLRRERREWARKNAGRL